MSPKYWEYFKIIEADLESTGRYVDFNVSNYPVFSNEYARILMASGSEIDNVMKDLCKEIDPSKSPKNIAQYFPIVTGKYSRFCEMKLTIPRFGLAVKPWDDWEQNSSPNWWKDGFNKIKHEREKHYSAANFGNCISSVAALLVVISYYYDVSSKTMPLIDSRFGPLLFSIEEDSSDWKGGGSFWTPSVLK